MFWTICQMFLHHKSDIWGASDGPLPSNEDMGSKMPNCLRTAMKRMMTTPMANSSMPWIPMTAGHSGPSLHDEAWPRGERRKATWSGPLNKAEAPGESTTSCFQRSGISLAGVWQHGFVSRATWEPGQRAGWRLLQRQQWCRNGKYVEADIYGKPPSLDPWGKTGVVSQVIYNRALSEMFRVTFRTFSLCTRSQELRHRLLLSLVIHTVVISPHVIVYTHKSHFDVFFVLQLLFLVCPFSGLCSR